MLQLRESSEISICWNNPGWRMISEGGNAVASCFFPELHKVELKLVRKNQLSHHVKIDV